MDQLFDGRAPVRDLVGEVCLEPPIAQAPPVVAKPYERETSALYAICNGRQRDWCKAVLPADISKVVLGVGDKGLAGRLAAHIGLRPPRKLLRDASLNEIGALIAAFGLSNFVIKPVTGKNSWCVAPMSKTAEGLFRHAVSGELFTLEALLARLDADYRRHGLERNLNGKPRPKAGLWLLEERLVDRDGHEPIDDYKFYACYGKVVALVQKRNQMIKGVWNATYRWFDDTWTPIDAGRPIEIFDHDLIPTEGRWALLAAAQAASKAMLAPFCRIDLYDTVEGPRFGEFTLAPGESHHFTPALDAEFGRTWSAACRRIEDDLASGALEGLLEAYRAARRVHHASGDALG